MKMNEPRKHHYCPQVYLNRFKNDNRKREEVCVFDTDKLEERRNKISDVAAQRDFYKMDFEDSHEDPYQIEKFFGEVEGNANIAIQHILDTKSFPVDESYDYLINFIAIMALRGPVHRKRMNDFQEQIMKKTLALTVSKKEIWDNQVKRAQEKGYDLSESNYDEMKEFVKKNEYRIEQDRSQAVMHMLKGASELVSYMHMRNWCIVVAAGSAKFIASDNPVGLTWSEDMKAPFPPGFGLGKTQVSFPLSPKIALVGTFEPLGIGPTPVYDKIVASLNNCTIQNIDRYIYSSDSKIAWIDKRGDIRGTKSLMEHFKLQMEVSKKLNVR